MVFRIFYSLVTCFTFIALSTAKFDYGLCPTTTTSHPNGSLNVTKLSGIWFEFLSTEGVKEQYNYDCASWLMMYNNPNDTSLTVINSL